MIPGSASPLLLKSAAVAGPVQIERSLRFNSSDSAYLSRTPAVAGNRRTWTWAGWVKKVSNGNTLHSFFAASSAGYYDAFTFGYNNSDTLALNFANSAGNGNDYGPVFETTQVFRDNSAWYHILIAVDTTQATAANRVRLYVNGSEVTAFSTTNYPAQNYETNDFNTAQIHYLGAAGGLYGGRYFNGYLADIHFIDGQQLTPSSFTEVSATTGQLIPKAYSGSFGTNGFWLKFTDNSSLTSGSNVGVGKDYSGNANYFNTSGLSVVGVVSHVTGGLSYRDSSSTNQTWDASSTSSSTSNAIGPDRRWWVDLGSSKSFNRITFNVVASGQSADTSTNFITHFSTTSNSGGSTICGGGCTVTSASRPSGATPGTITVTFAGFTSQTGRYIAISSGSGTQGGTYTYSNLQIYDDQGKDNDSLVDTPTSYGTDTGAGGEVRGNYCTWNPLSGGTLANGNLDVSGGSAVKGTVSVFTGKWYYEFTLSTNVGANPNLNVGVIRSNATSSGFVYDLGNALGALSGDVIGVALDVDAGKFWIAKNGTWVGSGNPGTGANATISSITLSGDSLSFYNSPYNAVSYSANFGQRAFAYTNNRSGFKALCDTNLGAPLVALPNTLMDAKLWTGTGATNAITGLGFSPDLLWIKKRSAAADHNLVDSVRVGARPFLLYPNLTNAENTSYTLGVQSLDSAGFTLGTDGDINASGATYVGWAWDAGTTTASNTQGSITSQVRANVSAGFSIVTYTGNGGSNVSVGHGLGVAPVLLIVKSRSTSGDWDVTYTFGDGSYDFMSLNTTAAKLDITGRNAPTSTLLYVNGGLSNVNATTYVCYAFAPVVGYSSFGSYTGNGSSDGPFVYTGFSPRWIMFKRTDAVENWTIYDTARDTYNAARTELFAHSSSAENAGSLLVDILSNGFKIRNTNGSFNASSATYIYMAFAENPFQYARAR